MKSTEDLVSLLWKILLEGFYLDFFNKTFESMKCRKDKGMGRNRDHIAEALTLTARISEELGSVTKSKILALCQGNK